MSNKRDFYVVYQNTDLNEGRGIEVPIHVCITESTAIRLAKRNGVQGTDAMVCVVSCEWNGTWAIGPVLPIKPTQEDELNEQGLIRRRADKVRRDKAITRAKALGLSDEDIIALQADIK